MDISRTALAAMIRETYADLHKVAGGLGDKITWRPLDKGRSALDQVQEVAAFGMLCALIFEAQKMIELDPDGLEKFRQHYDTPEKALEMLPYAADRAAKAIEAFPAEKMGDKIVLPFGGGLEKSFAGVALMTYWNAVYHTGQVNYIETLL